MLHQKLKIVKNNYWRRISQSEIRNSAAEKRGRAKILRQRRICLWHDFPPTPFLFARPSDWISEFAVRIFVKKSSDFNQKAPFYDSIISKNKKALEGFGKKLYISTIRT